MARLDDERATDAFLLTLAAAAQSTDLLPGMPPPLEPRDVYAAGDRAT